MTLPKYKINILREIKYSNFLIYIINGFQNQSDIRNEKKKNDGGTLISKARLSHWIQPIIKGVVLTNDENIKLNENSGLFFIKNYDRQYNEKFWEIKEGSFGDLFFKYIKNEYKKHKNEKEFMKKPSFDKYLSEENLKKEYHELIKKSSDKVKKIYEKRYGSNITPMDYILDNYSMKLCLFVEEIIFDYIKHEYKVNRIDLLSRTMEYNFEKIIKQLIDAYKLNMSGKSSIDVIFLSQEKDYELKLFLDLLLELRESENYAEFKILDMMDKYLNNKKSELSVKLPNGHAPNGILSHQFATFYPFQKKGLNKVEKVEEMV